MTSKLGVYWSVMHRRPQDYDYFKRLQPSVFKIMDGGPPDYQFAREQLPNALVIARDWALSEQHSDMLKDPVGTGVRHAQEWNQHQARLGFDRAKTLILGINEPRVWEPGVSYALREYTIALCDKATELGLRVGAMQLSVGWPNNDGPDTPPKWEPWRGVDNAIRRNNGALICHEYWADNGPSENWGWWAGRALKCPWDVPIVIGECGVDRFVKDGSVPHASRGWRGRLEPERYARELADYIGRMSVDRRFVGSCVFASDFASHEWFSFDVEPAYQAILATPIPDVQPPSKPIDTHLPSVGTGTKAATVPPLIHPIQDPAQRVISQRFGDNPAEYARFGLAGHNGLDFAVPRGTAVCAVDDGVPIEIENDFDGYGIYVKVRHVWGESLYAHLSQELCDVGKPLQAGETLGLSGYSGNVDPPGPAGAHLHLGIRVYPYQRGAPFDGYSDPLPYLASSPTPDPSDMVGIFKAAAQEFGVEWQLIASQAWEESSWRHLAESFAGARGVMQIMPATWAEWSAKIGAGDDLFDPYQNVRVGAAYLAWLLDQTNSAEDALIAYGFGIGNVLSAEPVPTVWIEYANKVLHGRDLLKAVGA